jgi:amino acid adenylation domain-containing protein
MYNLDFFEADEIEYLKTRFEFLLGEILRKPSVPICSQQIMPNAELKKILVDWNDTETDYPRDKTIIDLFEEQVENTPDHLAIVFEEQKLSYLELNGKANHLAHHLQKLGVGPEVLVGICVERSIKMVVGLLAILKAGGAYLPLDPAYPAKRLAFMLEDADISLLLTQSSLVNKLSSLNSLIVCLDTESEQLSRSDNPDNGLQPMNLAYVIYTSGSTGIPKGVMIEHHSLVNHNQAISREYQLTCNDRCLQFASVNFDVAAEEIFPTLLSGATLVLPLPEQLTSFAEFRQFIDTENLTVLNLPAPYWHEWVLDFSQTRTPLPKSLRLMVVGSEKVMLDSFTRWQQQVASNSIKWLNAYGPTEATITATLYQPTIGLHEKMNLPIGRPLANTQIYILDHSNQLVPIGVAGELYLGGSGLARGYLNRPALTIMQFIPNPFSNNIDARLYKTGDLARYLPDGHIEYLAACRRNNLS